MMIKSKHYEAPSLELMSVDEPVRAICSSNWDNGGIADSEWNDMGTF